MHDAEAFARGTGDILPLRGQKLCSECVACGRVIWNGVVSDLA